MNRSLRVLIIPLLSLLVAGVFSPYCPEAQATTPEQDPFQTAEGWVFSFVSLTDESPNDLPGDICHDQMLAPEPSESVLQVAERLLSD